LIANQIAQGYATTGVSGVVLMNQYGARFFDSPMLCSFLKVLSQKSRFLKPSAVANFKFSSKKPRIVNWPDWNQPTAASVTNNPPDLDGSSVVTRQLLRGCTVSIFILRGTAATDGTATAGYRIGIGNASVLIQARIECDWQAISPNYQTASHYQGTQGFSSGACGYPLPITAVYPIVDVVNTTTGARVPITTNPNTITDQDMTEL